MTLTEAVMLLAHIRNFFLIVHGLPDGDQKDKGLAVYSEVSRQTESLAQAVFKALKVHTEKRVLAIASQLEEEDFVGLRKMAGHFLSLLKSNDDWKKAEDNFLKQFRVVNNSEDPSQAFTGFSNFVTQTVFESFWEKVVSLQAERLLNKQQELIDKGKAELDTMLSKAPAPLEGMAKSLAKEQSSGYWDRALSYGWLFFQSAEANQQPAQLIDGRSISQKRVEVDRLEKQFKISKRNVEYWRSALMDMHSYEDVSLGKQTEVIAQTAKASFEGLGNEYPLFQAMNVSYLAFVEALARNTGLRKVQLTPMEVDGLHELATASTNIWENSVPPDLQYGLGYLDRIAPVYQIFENLDNFLNHPFYIGFFVETTYQQEDFKRIYKALSMVILGYETCLELVDARIKVQENAVSMLSTDIVSGPEMKKYLASLKRYKACLESSWQAPLRFIMALEESKRGIQELIQGLAPEHVMLEKLKQSLEKLEGVVSLLRNKDKEVNQVKDILFYLKELIKEENKVVKSSDDKPSDVLKLIQELKNLLNRWVSIYSRDESKWDIVLIQEQITEVFKQHNYIPEENGQLALSQLYQKYFQPGNPHSLIK